jgi:hypothetical protein
MEMEQMAERLLAEIRTNQTKTDANLKETKVNQRQVIAEMDGRLEGAEACVGILEANPEKSEAAEKHQGVRNE